MIQEQFNLSSTVTGQKLFFLMCVIMATNFLELATTLKYLGAKGLLEKKVNFMPWTLISGCCHKILESDRCNFLFSFTSKQCILN